MHRRDLLLGSAALAGGLALPRAGNASLLGDCPIPSPTSTEGPFYIPGADRLDITEGIVGFPVQIFIRVMDRTTCTPIPNLLVDIWHTDPPGTYSGFASEGTLGETFMRGTQPTNTDGITRFVTVFPGWYPVRTPHVHVKVYDTMGAELFTGQVYFPDAVADFIYARDPAYAGRGPHPVRNGNDGLYRGDMELEVQRWGPGGRGGITLTV